MKGNIIKFSRFCTDDGPGIMICTPKVRHFWGAYQFTGVSLAPIIKNLELINEQGIEFVVRLPIIPGLNDRKEHFDKVKSLAKNMQFCKGIEVMPYHSLGMYKYELLQREYLCSDISEPDNETFTKWKSFL